MKVMHLVPAMEQGGVETVVCALNRVAVEAGWECVVVSKGGRLVKRIEEDGGRHLTLDVKSKNPFTYFGRAAKLRGILAVEKPSLVCVHSRVPAWLFVWANRKLGVKWLTYAHGANSVSCYSEVMTKGDLTVVPSRFLADYLKTNYRIPEEKIRVIHPAVDSKRFDPEKLDVKFVEKKRREWGVETDDFVVMTVGRITPVKGCDTLIRAYAALNVGNKKLVFVGDADKSHQDYLVSLKGLVKTLGLDERSVVFASGESKVPECLSIASVVVSANTRKPESFGLSMAEALMMNKPVVAKAFGGALDVVRDGIDGVLVHDDDFAGAIAKAREMDFADLRKSALTRFDYGIMSRETIDLYRQI